MLLQPPNTARFIHITQLHSQVMYLPWRCLEINEDISIFICLVHIACLLGKPDLRSTGSDKAEHTASDGNVECISNSLKNIRLHMLPWQLPVSPAKSGAV